MATKDLVKVVTYLLGQTGKETDIDFFWDRKAIYILKKFVHQVDSIYKRHIQFLYNYRPGYYQPNDII